MTLKEKCYGGHCYRLGLMFTCVTPPRRASVGGIVAEDEVETRMFQAMAR